MIYNYTDRSDTQHNHHHWWLGQTHVISWQLHLQEAPAAPAARVPEDRVTQATEHPGWGGGEDSLPDQRSIWMSWDEQAERSQ